MLSSALFAPFRKEAEKRIEAYRSAPGAVPMHEVSIDEPLRKVYVLFGEGKIRPIALEWGQRKLKVARVNSSWIDRSLRPCRHGFSLTMDSGEIFQVSYEEGNPVWKLEYMLTD